jgi:hypothetical protein
MIPATPVGPGVGVLISSFDRLGVKLLTLGGRLAQAFALEEEPVRVVHQSVEIASAMVGSPMISCQCSTGSGCDPPLLPLGILVGFARQLLQHRPLDRLQQLEPADAELAHKTGR